jgi:hypothetical protein
MPMLSREVLIEAAKRAARESAVPLGRTEFTRRTGISRWHIARVFPEGRWTELRTLAGIARCAMDHPRPANDELLAEFHRVVLEHGRIPTWAVFGNKRQIGSEALLRKRFQGVAGLWQAYRDWLQAKEPDSPVLRLLAAEAPRTGGRRLGSPKPDAAVSHWAGNAGFVFGPPLDFRGLRHAPINEQGVVYIFGMVSYELGFIVEGLQSAFPDCEAMRRTGWIPCSASITGTFRFTATGKTKA